MRRAVNFSPATVQKTSFTSRGAVAVCPSPGPAGGVPVAARFSTGFLNEDGREHDKRYSYHHLFMAASLRVSSMALRKRVLELHVVQGTGCYNNS